MSYVSEVIAAVEAKHPHETEFLQTVKEVLTSIEPAVNDNSLTETDYPNRRSALAYTFRMGEYSVPLKA